MVRAAIHIIGTRRRIAAVAVDDRQPVIGAEVHAPGGLGIPLAGELEERNAPAVSGEPAIDGGHARTGGLDV